MRARNWFEVGVRLSGLWEITDGLHALITYLNAATRMYVPRDGNPIAFLTIAAAHFLIGFFLLLYAMSVVNAVYPPPELTKNQPPNAT